MYTCIIIDDEQHAIAGLELYIHAMPQLMLVKCYSDPLEALTGITESVDFIFLDIDMPKINGIELAREIRNRTSKLVFTTAYTKYALEAFEVHGDAYLLKPFSLGKFMITVNRMLPVRSAGNTQAKNDFFFVKSKADDLKLIKVCYGDLIAIESRRNDVMIHTLTRNILTYMSLMEISKLLDLPNFIQVHRSFIINQEQIDCVTGNQVKLLNGMELTVGETFRKDFNRFIAKKLIKAGKKSDPALNTLP